MCQISGAILQASNLTPPRIQGILLTMTRILITGASGLLGLNLALDAGGLHTVIGVDRNTLDSAPFQVIKADLLDPEAHPNILKESNRRP